MIETIWPLSNYPCRTNGVPVDRQVKTVSGLRTYVQELLRRSRTSYSTLQVALYYLVLIQGYLPKQDFTQEQSWETHARISLQCGRRMFLSALILAGKYLQDKTYSARAWSRISGLSCAEINVNEKRFLETVNWQLHVPEERFHRWTDIVFKYSPAQSPLLPGVKPLPSDTWKTLIPRLTAQLDNVEVGIDSVDTDSGYESSSSKGSSLDSPPLRPYFDNENPLPSPTSGSLDTLPATLEPTPYEYVSIAAPPPPVPSLGYLPTPVLTPANCNISTPAVSAYSACSRRSSMSLAMGEVRRSSFARSVLDRVDSSPADLVRCQAIRRSSLQHQLKSVSPTSAPSSSSSCPRVHPRPSSLAPSSRAAGEPAARRCITMTSWGTPEGEPEYRAVVPVLRASTFPMVSSRSQVSPPSSNLSPTRDRGGRDDGHGRLAQISTANVESDMITFLDDQASQRRAAAEPQFPTLPRLGSTMSRKRGRPLSVDLSTSIPAGIIESLATASETSSTSTTPRPRHVAGSDVVIVEDDRLIGTPTACSVASRAVRDSPRREFVQDPSLKPATKVQKTARGHDLRFSAGTASLPQSLLYAGGSCSSDLIPGVMLGSNHVTDNGSMFGLTR